MNRVQRVVYALGLVAVCQLFPHLVGWAPATAADLKTITFKFDIPAVAEGGLFPLIYVKGELAGIVPGTVEIPSDAEGAAVEIGVSALVQPLYSLVLGPAEFSELSADLVIANVELELEIQPDKTVEDTLKFQPNLKRKINIDRQPDEHYELTLPIEPYLKITGLLQRHKRDEIGQLATFDETAGGASHVVFNAATNTTTQLAQGVSWSGAQVAFGKAIFPEQNWIINSDPPGADVFTDTDWAGRTRVEKRFDISSHFFVLLKMEGYVDCPDRKCKRNQIGDNVELNCKLKRLAKKK